MINPVRFLKEACSGTISTLLGLFVLISVHNISKIDFVAGIWCIIQGFFLIIKWWQNKTPINLVLGILNLVVSVPLVLKLYNAKIPMIYLVIFIFILNACNAFNGLYITGRDHLILTFLLYLMIATVLLLILYPWLKQIIWLPIFSIFMIAYGMSYILYAVISLK